MARAPLTLCGVLVTTWLASAATWAPERADIDPVPCPSLSWEVGDAAFEPLAGAAVYFGRYEGGLYRIEVPERWNGDLVLYAHGYRGVDGENGRTLRAVDAPIREHLVEEGFAWAASSYRCNGYVPGQGLEDTMALVELFTSLSGGRVPGRVYLTGTSMGGHVTLLGMHQYPTRFAGGLAMCPAGPGLFDFFTAVGAAAEVITGVRFTGDDTREASRRMAALLGAPPDYTEKGRQLASVQIQISGGSRPFAVEGLESRFLSNISGSALADGSSPPSRAVDTGGFTYAIDPGLGISADALNEQARRKAGDPAVRGTGGPHEELMPFDGRIARPLLTMHGTGDLYVPVFLERTLHAAVRDAGRGDLLVQRLYRIPGHCRFSQQEMTKSFDDLVAWVMRGARPDGDDVWADLIDAGRTFTDPIREGDPGTTHIAPRR